MAAGDEIIFWTVLIVYLAFLAIAGIFAKKKTKTLEDFMVAGRKIGPLLLGLSFGVTYFSAVMIVGGGLQSWIWGLGVVWIASIDVLVGVFLVFVFFGGRTKSLGKHFESMTVPQFISKRYEDPKLQTFTSIVILFFETIYLVSIYMGLAVLLSVIFPTAASITIGTVTVSIPYLVSVVLCGVITIIYLTVGGAHGAIWTDAVESVIMLVGVLLIFFAGIIAVGGFTGLTTTLGSIDPDLLVFPGEGGIGLIGYILVTSFGVWGMPQMISRFYTAEKQSSIKWGLVISCFWAFIVAIFAWFNGSIARALQAQGYPGMASANPTNAVPVLMAAVLPSVLAGLFLAAVTAASLTTGEKVIMIAASGFSIDVYQKRTKCSDDQALKVTRLTTLVVVAVAVVLAILQPDAVLALCMFAWSAMAAVILVPYVFGLFWKGGTAKAALYSGAASFIVAIMWKIIFRGGSLWAMVGGSGAWAIWGSLEGVVLLGQWHEFIISQVVALIAFPLISMLTKDSKPSAEFLNEIFSVMKKSHTEE